MPDLDLVSVRWYPVVDDCIGGWAIATRDAPVSQLDSRFEGSDRIVGEFLTEEVARRVCTLHNAELR